MKVCPACKTVYKDDDINFCLADGTTLLAKKGKTQEHSLTNDIVAIIVAAAALLVFLSLVTNSPADRSLFSTGAATSTRNWVGPIGSNIAAVFLNLFGWTAYFFPFLIGLIAWRVFRASSLRPSGLRVAGFVFLSVSLAGLIALFGGYGAIIGEATAQGTAHLIGNIGAGILLAAVLACSLILVTNATLAGFLSHMEVAGSGIYMRASGWFERLMPEGSTDDSAAKLRAEKRREIREKVDDAGLPPTVVIPDIDGQPPSIAKNTKKVEVDDTSAISVPTVDADPYATTKVADDTSPDEADGSAPKRSRKKKAETSEESDAAASESASTASPDYADYRLPTSDLLTPPAPYIKQDDSELFATAKDLTDKTTEFNVGGKVMNITRGPVVTTYEFKPAAGVKYSRVTGLVDDLCLALKAESIRIDRIPGKAYVGIEVPNRKRETIYLREIIEGPEFTDSKALLTLALGKTIDGTHYVTELAKMPHLLIAGATGAGKSVGVNTLVMSILYRARPDQVKFIMVDPKRLELGLYADIPHLAVPIITDPKRASNALRWAVGEMERRYKDLAGYGVRNIDGYNVEAKRRNDIEQWDENGEPHKILPYIVIIIDELADLMMVSGKDVEESITRLAQMARAVGIHLILATQRPSVDVITGLIKANFPSRISFRVSSKVDSRTIIDGNGAESLLGMGDMLFLPPGNSNVTRVHGAFVNEAEIKKVVEFIKAQNVEQQFDKAIVEGEEESAAGGSSAPGRQDPLYFEALKSVVLAKRGSTSLLQRQLRIGYGRAAAILDAMVIDGYIGEMDGSTRARPVLTKAYEDVQDLSEMENDQ
ncbi:MAG TPA: DNA translocase FtsK 4TM domain-containing protein [Pyrinomonadaceae bacterium]|nr:DNA translocase FtsK 4TM domain-containing protein [Pyrinomonadaceae bacterium]